METSVIENPITVRDWEKKFQEIRSRNGWRIVLECSGVWVINIYDKETDKLLASTGGTGIEGLLHILEMPFDRCPWK